MKDLVLDNKNTLLIGETIISDITIKSDGAIIKNCKINGSIHLENASNCLIAQCEINGNISVNDAYNISLVLNKSANITCRDNTNVYVIENETDILSLW